MTFDGAISKITSIALSCKRYKIGKTSQSLTERFDSVYKDDHDRIVLICHSPSSTLIDDWEKRLIEHFTSALVVRDNCGNQQVGGGAMEKADVYRVYVVVKE